MGSSTKRKKEKKKDFQKPKLRVGKTKPIAANFTDTSFKAKTITITQQSLSIVAPSDVTQFTHYLSLASTSKSDSQRRDALSYLTTQLSSQPVSNPLPLPSAILLHKLLPLILDGAAPVRKQLLKLLRCLPSSDIADKVETALLYTRAGMTHLAEEIRLDALNVLEWLLAVAGEEVVACPGGWMKTLKSFMSMMGWAKSTGLGTWSAATKVSFSKAGRALPRQMGVFAQLLSVGLLDRELSSEDFTSGANLISWNLERHMLPKRANAYAHLNLFGGTRDEEGEMYSDREDRQTIFQKRFLIDVEEGISNARKEAGEAGRAAAILGKIVRRGFADFDAVDDTP